MKEAKKKFKNYAKRPSYSIKERSIRWSLRTLAYLTVAVTLSILFILISDTVTFFRAYSPLDFFLGTRWEPFGEPKHLGVLPLVVGSLMIAAGSIAVAVPLGIGSAVYLTQYAGKTVRETVGPVIEILGGIPTVVYGYFALTVVTPLLRQIFPQIETFNALSASIVVGISIMPMISSISSESIRQVPSSIKHAGYALGMRKISVILRIIIPAGLSGIISSVILAFSRAIGETMAVTLAAGATPRMDVNYLEGVQTITAFIVQISLGDTPAGSIEYYTIYALGLTLFGLTFFFNYIASVATKKFGEIYE